MVSTDAIHVKMRGDGGGAEPRTHLFTEIKDRGVNDVLVLVCDGLKGPGPPTL